MTRLSKSPPVNMMSSDLHASRWRAFLSLLGTTLAVGLLGGEAAFLLARRSGDADLSFARQVSEILPLSIWVSHELMLPRLVALACMAVVVGALRRRSGHSPLSGLVIFIPFIGPILAIRLLWREALSRR